MKGCEQSKIKISHFQSHYVSSMKNSIRLQAQSVWWIFPTTSQMNNVSSNWLWFIGKYRIIVGMKYWDLYAMSISKSLHSPKLQGRGTLEWKDGNRANQNITLPESFCIINETQHYTLSTKCIKHEAILWIFTAHQRIDISEDLEDSSGQRTWWGMVITAWWLSWWLLTDPV